MGVYLRAERAKLGISAAEAARLIGVHVNTLKRWERGETMPQADNIAKLASLYGVSMEDLMRDMYVPVKPIHPETED